MGPGQRFCVLVGLSFLLWTVPACDEDEQGSWLDSGAPDGSSSTEAGTDGGGDGAKNDGTGGDGADGDGAGGDGTGGDGAGADGYPSRQDYCKGSGPPILVTGTKGKLLCTGKMAQVVFRYALCTCEGVTAAAQIKTDSFDHTKGPYTPGSAGKAASAGVNGKLTNTQPMDIGGSLYVGSSSGVSIGANITAGVDLHSAGPVMGSGSLTVKGDAEVNGNVSCTNLDIGGTLTIPKGKTVYVPSSRKVGKLVYGPVTVAPPCDCAPKHLYDIAGLVKTYSSINDNAAIKLDPSKLLAYTAPTKLELPCGRFYLKGISGSGGLTIHVTGRTALFVDGSVVASGGVKVTLGPKGELDLFVAGDLSSSGTLSLGSAAEPSRVRLYAGGKGYVNLGAGATFAGNLYAPYATLQAAGNQDVYGAVFVKSINISGKLTIHYDLAILEAGAKCPPKKSGQGCSSCHDCGNQACVNGKCGKCTANSQCCKPLYCVAGKCIPKIK